MSKGKHKDWDKVAEEAQAAEVEELNLEEDEDNEITPVLEAEEQGAALEHPSYEELEAKLTTAEEKAFKNWEKVLHLTAEMENMRKRAERDVVNAHKFANEKILNDLFPVLDTFEKSLENESGGDVEGLKLTYKLFLDTLAKFNVKQIDPMGEAFDPNLHEALTTQEQEGAKAGVVLAVIQKGYILNDRLIRPARVIVAK